MKNSWSVLPQKHKILTNFSLAFFAATAVSACNLASGNAEYTQQTNLGSNYGQDKQALEFSFTAFGDSGWADTHVEKPIYTGGFKRAFVDFDSINNVLGDINYLNWETSIGTHCDQFWSRLTPSTYAFITHPHELEDVADLGFNLIGLANNHTFDCIRSSEGIGPIQSYRFIHELSVNKPGTFFSGIFKQPSEEPVQAEIELAQGNVPVTFLSAYVGGDDKHCKNISCAINLYKAKNAFKDRKRLRVLALHSWNKSSHKKLKSILKNWISLNLVDIAIGTGPHIAESVEIVKTNYGNKLLATSLGNFIHPSLSPQPFNIVLQTRWRIQQYNQEPTLIEAKAIKASCDGGKCTHVGIMDLSQNMNN